MNYYDEEIMINSSDIRPQNVKAERIPSRGSNNGKEKSTVSERSINQQRGLSMVNRSGQLTIDNLKDDDGLLQDIIDHDDQDDEENSDIEEEKVTTMKPLEKKQQEDFPRNNDLFRSRRLPAGSKIINLPTAKALDIDTEPSETESDEADHRIRENGKGHAAISEDQSTFTAEKWESLSLDTEIKELFPYILKYTPQNIETTYHLQPFIPDYVPAVGDVDAFLKVTEPPHLSPERSKEIHDYLHKLGLYFLDEPSGSQSEPSLLNMKLRSALTSNSKNTFSNSAQVVPFAKSTKDIDKWINDVEQMHMSQSVFDGQPRKDIEKLLIDWPHSYADAALATQDAYQQCRTAQYSVVEYIRILCQHFLIEGPLETQADYLLSTQTLFALYLAASQAWE